MRKSTDIWIIVKDSDSDWPYMGGWMIDSVYKTLAAANLRIEEILNKERIKSILLKRYKIEDEEKCYCNDCYSHRVVMGEE